MSSIKAFPVLEGVRGQPGVDLDAVADLLVRLSVLVTDPICNVAEMDLNPVIAYPGGRPPSVVDVRRIARISGSAARTNCGTRMVAMAYSGAHSFGSAIFFALSGVALCHSSPRSVISVASRTRNGCARGSG